MQIKPPFQVICIDDTRKPKEIPQEKWVVNHTEYTVEKVGKTLDGKLGFVLKEITLTPDEYPFELFSAKRFVVLHRPPDLSKEDEEDFLNQVKDLLNIE